MKPDEQSRTILLYSWIAFMQAILITLSLTNGQPGPLGINCRINTYLDGYVLLAF
jgi:hypothetical protein